jgi:DNA-binding response OmpR family regulator
MISSAKIVFARKDLSIPGAPESFPAMRDQSDIEEHFFHLIDDNEPDVIVLDCIGASWAVTDAIQRVRRRTNIPIIVLCQPVDELLEHYRSGGAADCVTSPIDFVALHKSIQRVMGELRQQTPAAARRP